MKTDQIVKLEKSDIEKILGQPISNFSISAGSKKGDNVAGDLTAINVTTEKGEKLNLLYKGFPTNRDPEQQQYVKQFGIFRTETCMYERILPRLQQLLNNRKAKGNPELCTKLPIVKYISGFNDDQNDYVCLEDVRPQGFTMQDKFKSLTLPEVTLIMKEMARFHALTFFMIRYDGDKMFEEDDIVRRIKYNVLTVENPMLSEMFSRMFKTYFENTIELLEPRDKELAEQVRKFNAKSDHHRLHALQRFNHNRTDKSIFACIIHGDLWTNNILFKYAQQGNRDTPTELKFIDFQLSRRGNIFEDLGYFFWTSTDPAFRKLHLMNMLNEYFNSFEDTLVNQLNFPMPTGFTKGSFIDGFQQGILAAYAYMPFALSLQMGNLDFLKEEKVDNGTEANGDKDKEAAPQQPPAFDMSKMIETGKRLHKLRMVHSPKALERLEELTREIVEMKLLN